jgi:Uma2 family endonuclease
MAKVPNNESTEEDLMNLSPGMGWRYELIEGHLKTMPTSGGQHGTVIAKIAGEIFVYQQKHKSGLGLVNTGFYTRGDRRTVRAADFAFITADKIPPDGLPEGYVNIAPSLVVEIVNPNNTTADKEEKTIEWLAFGVMLVWSIYVGTKTIRVYRNGLKSFARVRGDEVLHGESVLPGFSLPLKDIFQA